MFRRLLAAVLCLAPSVAFAQSLPSPALNAPTFANQAQTRTNLGLGTIATQSASSIAVTGGTIDGATIGGTTPAAGKFSTINTTSAYQQNGLSILNMGTAAGNPVLAIGASAGAAMNFGTATFDVYVGYAAGQNSPGNLEATCVGVLSCQYLTAGTFTSAFGEHSLGYETGAAGNSLTCFGNDCMRNVVGAASSNAFGKSALAHGRPFYDVAIGTQSQEGNASAVFLTGTVTTGDVVSLTFTGTFTGSPTTVSYTAAGGNTLSTIASALASAFNAALGAQDFTATAVGPNIWFTWHGTGTTGNTIVITSGVTGSATEVVASTNGYAGSANNSLGYQSMSAHFQSSGSVSNNTFGNNTMQKLTTGNQNNCFGDSACQSLTTDTKTTAVGDSAGFSIAGGGSGDTCFGFRACYGMTTGGWNIVIGQNDQASGQNSVTTGNGNLSIGLNAAVASPTASYQMNIQGIIWGAGNTGSGTTISTGQIGVGVKAPSATFSVGDAAGSATQGTHIAIMQTTAPTVSNGTLDAKASDVAGTITLTAANPVVTFNKAFATTPHCVVSSPSGAAFTYAAATGTLTLTGGANTNTATYICLQ